MKKLLIAVAFFISAGSGFVLGYLTHRNDWIAMETRTRVRVLLGMQKPTTDKTLFEGQFPRAQWAPAEPTSELSGEAMEALGAIGYVDGVTPAAAQATITVHDPTTAQPGLNVVVSAHAPEAVLMTLTGETVHTWSKAYEDVWPDSPGPRHVASVSKRYWRRVHVFPNGDLLAIFGGLSLIKLDRDSNLVWALQGEYHHHLQVTAEGHIHILDQRRRHVMPRFNESDPILEDFLVTLDADGNELHRVSLIECFENSDYAPVLDLMPRYGDVFHTNTLQVLDGRHAAINPAFKAGHVLVSIWKLNTVAVVDPAAAKVVWAVTGLWSKQHESQLLDTGAMLVFDNQGGKGKTSRILEIDPNTQAILWAYESTAETPFYSELCGAVQRLPNGNTLITESYKGRAFEVTLDKRIVWEYYNPQRAGPDDAFIANLFEVYRIEERPAFLAN